MMDQVLKKLIEINQCNKQLKVSAIRIRLGSSCSLARPGDVCPHLYFALLNFKLLCLLRSVSRTDIIEMQLMTKLGYRREHKCYWSPEASTVPHPRHSS